MTGFADSFPDEVLLDVLGDDIVYTPLGGAPVAVKAVVDFDVFGDDYHNEKRNEVELLKSSIGAPIQRGDRFEYNGAVYVLDTLLEQDGHYERWGLADG